MSDVKIKGSNTGDVMALIRSDDNPLERDEVLVQAVGLASTELWPDVEMDDCIAAWNELSVAERDPYIIKVIEAAKEEAGNDDAATDSATDQTGGVSSGDASTGGEDASTSGGGDPDYEAARLLIDEACSVLEAEDDVELFDDDDAVDQVMNAAMASQNENEPDLPWDEDEMAQDYVTKAVADYLEIDHPIDASTVELSEGQDNEPVDQSTTARDDTTFGSIDDLKAPY